MSRLFSTLFISSALFLSACSGEGAEKKEGATVEAASSGELAQTAAGATGVPECDEYLTKVMACVEDKMPAEQKDMLKKALDDSKASWAQVTDKTQLANTCKQAMDQAKASYSAMGCQF